MRTMNMFSQIRLLILLCVIPCFALNLTAEESSIGKDTLVYKPFRDTVR